MAFSFNARLLLMAALASSLTAKSQAQDPYAPPPPGRPGVSIGGPFGVIIGGGRGVRIGGPSGVQFGGGEGVRIGPRDYGPPPTGGPGGEFAPEHPTARFIDPRFESALPGETLLHYPQSAENALRIRINGEEAEIYPGDTLAVPNSGRTSIQIARPIGGFGWRRTLRPGVYVFRQAGRGWTIAAGEIPTLQDNEPTQATPESTDPDLNAPEIEQLPAPPPPGQVEAQEASDDEGLLRRLFRRRR